MNYCLSAPRWCRLVLALAFTVSMAHGQTYSIIHDFIGGPGGEFPYDGLIMDRAGNFYGTTYYGGSNGQGMVFKLSRHNGSWIFAPIYSFRAGNDGANPYAGVTIGPDGNLYGTTYTGGQGAPGCPGGCGTVYKLTPPANICHSSLCQWNEAVVYNFYQSGVGLRTPAGAVIFDAAGNMYGTTTEGGTGDCSCGAVYKLSPAGSGWTAIALYSFSNQDDGAVPYAGLVMDPTGNLYGTAYYSQNYDGYGTVFELINSAGSWSERTLYEFQGGSDGGYPQGGLILDASGNLYGGTSESNMDYLTGVVFELSPSGANWDYSVISTSNGSMVASLSLDPAGNLYGTSVFAGAHNNGTVFKLSNSGGRWTQTDLHDFSSQNHDGYSPECSVTIDANGNLFGTTSFGGTTSDGTVWEITPQ
jgi:uncharacterized repeat protein (TIGR03803 family)